MQYWRGLYFRAWVVYHSFEICQDVHINHLYFVTSINTVYKYFGLENACYILIIVAFLQNAPIEHSSESVCASMCVCVCVCFCTITQKVIDVGT